MAEFIDISTESNPCDIVWEGAGWYAPRQHYASGGWYTRFYYVSSEQEYPEEVPSGLGTPDWFDEPKKKLSS